MSNERRFLARFMLCNNQTTIIGIKTNDVLFFLFVDEARNLARLCGLPGIVYVRDYFKENATVYIAMEFAEGETLKEILEKSRGRLPANTVFAMMKPVDGTFYKGNYVNDNREGYGLCYFPDGNKYIGQLSGRKADAKSNINASPCFLYFRMLVLSWK